MNCVAFASADPSSIAIRRSVEVVSYTERTRHMAALLLLLVESGKPGNSLRMLWRGEAVCRRLPAYPLPRASTEAAGAGVLQSVYGPMFRKNGKGVSMVSDLRPWDERVALAPGVPVCAAEGRGPERDVVVDPAIAWEFKSAPFSAWTARIPAAGLNLLAFEVRLDRTGHAMPPGEVSLSIDGPERALARIEYGDCSGLTAAARAHLMPWVEEFSDRARQVPHASRDIVVLGPPNADAVVRSGHGGAGFYIAPAQPAGGRAERYITTDASFTIPLSLPAEPARR